MRREFIVSLLRHCSLFSLLTSASTKTNTDCRIRTTSVLRVAVVTARKGSGFSHGTGISANCRSSHRLVNGTSVASCVRGQWKPSQPRCEPAPCLAMANSSVSPLFPDDPAELHDGLYSHNAEVRLRCAFTHRPVQNRTTSTCRFGTWRPQTLQCEPKPCTIPELYTTRYKYKEPLRASQLEINNGIKISVACKDTGDRNRSPMVECRYGRWVPPIQPCRTDSCTTLKTKGTDMVVISGQHRAGTRVRNGTVARLVCQSGYAPRGNVSVATCIAGAWRPEALECEEILCSIPGHLIISFVEQDESESRHSPKGINVTVRCPQKFGTQMPVSTTCRNGVWIPSLPRCSLVPQYYRGMVQTSIKNSPEERIEGSDKDVSTQDLLKSTGYHGRSPDRNCYKPVQGNGVVFTWDFLLQNGTGGKVPHGAKLTARCSDIGAFKLVGSSVLVCRNAQWTGRLPFCQKNEEDREAPPSIYYNVTRGQQGKGGQFLITLNGTLAVDVGSTIQLSCIHRLFDLDALQWNKLSAVAFQWLNGRKTLSLTIRADQLAFDEYRCTNTKTKVFHSIYLSVADLFT